MRRRVLMATVSAVAVAVILLGLPLALIGATLVRDNEIRSLQSRTSELGRSIENRLARDEQITPDLLERYVGGDDGNLQGYVQVFGVGDSVRPDRIHFNDSL